MQYKLLYEINSAINSKSDINSDEARYPLVPQFFLREAVLF